MIYDTLHDIICRQGELSDYDRIIEIMSPLVITEGAHESFNKMEIKSLLQATKYFIKSGNCVVTEKDGIVVGVYTGKGNKIGSLGNVGGVNSVVLLLKVALCDVQNAHREAIFQVANDKIRAVYEGIKTPLGAACEIDELGNGVVTIQAKKEILNLFNRLKG